MKEKVISVGVYTLDNGAKKPTDPQGGEMAFGGDVVRDMIAKSKPAVKRMMLVLLYDSIKKARPTADPKSPVVEIHASIKSDGEPAFEKVVFLDLSQEVMIHEMTDKLACGLVDALS